MGSASCSVWLLSLVLSWGFPSPHTTLSYAAVYYVTPHSPNPDCPSGETCFTIDEYAQGSHLDGEDNITLLFLNGEHNLTARDFEIDHKALLRMAPSHVYTEAHVVIQFLNGTHVFVSSLLEFEIIGLKLVSPNSEVPSGVVIIDIDLLVLTKIWIESCRLSIQGKIKAAITELTASNSSVYSAFSSHNNHTVDISNSEFHFSALEIRDDNTSRIFFSDIASTLSLESSSMRSSHVSVKLQTQATYKLSICNSSIASTSGDHSFTSNTGIRADIRNTTTLHVFIRNCSIVGNDHALNITADGNSSVELSVDQCFIDNNGPRHEHKFEPLRYGGIEVSYLGNPPNIAMIVVSIIATILSGSTNSHFVIRGIIRNISVSVFNSTLKDLHIHHEKSLSCDEFLTCGGAYFPAPDVNDSAKYKIINFTQNLFENNSIGIFIGSDTSDTFVHFNNNTVIHHNRVGLLVAINYMHMSIANSLFAYSATAIRIFAYSSLVTITDTIIAQNGNGILVPWGESYNTMIIENSQVKENVGVSLGLEILKPIASVDKGTNILVRNVTYILQ